MANRYEELFLLSPNLFLEGCPVIIAAGALQKDTVSDRVLAQLKLRNLENKRLIACKVSIRAFEPNGEELEGIAVFSYLDQNADLGVDFGSKTPIYLPDKNTRRFSAAVTEVVFDDGSLWRGEACEWQPVPEQEMLAAKLPDEELRDEYVREVEALCGYVPVIRKGLFQCACGTVNLSTAEVCYNCRRSFDFLTEKMNPEYLAARREIRLQREREEREAAEREAAEAEEAARIAAEKARVEKERRAEKIKKVVVIVATVAAVCAVFILVYINVIVPNLKLNKAKALLKSEDYEEAYTILEELRDTDAILANKYDRAMTLIDAGEYEASFELLNGLNYRDSEEKLKNAKIQYQRLRLSESQVGEYIIFGAYEQDNDSSNGKEEIEWLVLEKEDDRIFVISRYGLDCQKYHSSDSRVTWEQCSLRKWLNETFVRAAFSDDEQILIDDVTNAADKVILLSSQEAKAYFAEDIERECQGTAYCYAQGAGKASNGNCWWWLRTKHRIYGTIEGVSEVGYVSTLGRVCDYDGNAVRPALWLRFGT